MSKSEIIRVLVADDHPVVCYGLSAIISAQKTDLCLLLKRNPPGN
jgi:DNA-binding NarL/FixJ family response regulator